MILGKVLKEFRLGNIRTLPELASKLNITFDELKSALDILVASGKLKKTKQTTNTSSSCGGCSSKSSCPSCSGCMAPSKTGTEIAEKNSISFYELA